jgi:hypothetical protein
MDVIIQTRLKSVIHYEYASQLQPDRFHAVCKQRGCFGLGIGESGLISGSITAWDGSGWILNQVQNDKNKFRITGSRLAFLFALFSEIPDFSFESGVSSTSF